MAKMFVPIAMTMFMLGCQTMPYQPYARDVKRKPQQGGVIALKTEHREEDRAKATSMMQSNCGDKAVKVIEEGEVTVGQTTSGSAKETNDLGSDGTKVGSVFGIPLKTGGVDPSKNTATSSTVTALNEWQINYECAVLGKKTSKN